MKSYVSTTDENIPPLGCILEAGGKLADSWASDSEFLPVLLEKKTIRIQKTFKCSHLGLFMTDV